MGLAWFIYTIAIILVAVFAASTSMTMWVLTSRKGFLVASAAFALYVFEVAVILYGEYAGDKPYLQGYMDNGLVTPVPTIIISALLVGAVWAWMLMRVHAKADKARLAIFTVAFGVVSAILAPVHGDAGRLRTIAFWGLRDLALIGSLAYAFWYYRAKATENERGDIERDKGFFRVLAVLACCMLAEDVVNITFVDPQVRAGSLAYEFFWHLTERNISENVAMIFCAAHVVMEDRELMKVFSRHPAEQEGDDAKADLDSRIDLKLPRFADDHGMSDREREVLELLLKDKTTNEIAQELYISPGTVKAHLHRIYTKAGVDNRKDLATTFWRS